MTGALRHGELVDGKYRIVRFIGRGGWASVYEGLNVRLQRRVAIKILNGEMISEDKLVERFFREARAATRIESDHVVRVFDLGAHADGRPYIVMELLDGENLEAQLARRPRFSPRRAVYYAIQAVRGLADAHGAGVLHRDIKPGNIVVVKTKTGDELVKIVDFGISKVEEPDASTMTQTNTMLGSPIYMSPEQCRGIQTMDARSDLYSLGVVMFEMLTGSRPHVGATPQQIMFTIALEDAVSPLDVNPQLDPELAAIVHKTLARDPAARFQTATDLEAALVAWGKDHGVDASRRSSERLPMLFEDEATSTLTNQTRSAEVNSLTQRSAESSQQLGAQRAAADGDGDGDLVAALAPSPPATSVPVTSELVDAGTQTGDLTVSSTHAPNVFEDAGPSARRRRWTGIAVGVSVGIAISIVLLALGAHTSRAPTSATSSTSPLAPSSTAVASTTATVTVTTTGSAESADPTPGTSGARASSQVPSIAANATNRRVTNGGPPTTTTGASRSASAAIATPSAAAAPVLAADAGGVVDGRRIRTDF